MSLLRFEIEINGIVQEVTPENFRSIQLGYEFDYKSAKFTDIPTLQFCSKSLLADIKALDVCDEIIFRVFETDLKNPDQIFYQGLIQVKDIQDNCFKDGLFSAPVRRQSILKDLEENENDRLCKLTDTQLQLFQLESGGYYVDMDNEPITGNFISLLALVNDFYNRTGGQGSISTLGGDRDLTLTGLGSNSNYSPARMFIHPTSIPNAGQVINITFSGEYGQQYDVTITAPTPTWPDGQSMLEDIRNAILCYAGKGELSLGMTSWEMYSRVATAAVANTVMPFGLTLRIESYWNFSLGGATITIDGVNSWSSSVETHQPSDGSDMFISGPGLRNEICISWAELSNIINKILGTYPQEVLGSEGIEFYPYINLDTPNPQLVTGFADPIMDARTALREFDSEFMVSRVEPGYSFRINEYEEDRDEWIWNPARIFPDQNRFTPPASTLSFIVLDFACPVIFQGNIVLTNLAGPGPQNYTLDFKVNGVVQDNLTGTIPQGNSETIPLSLTFPLLGSNVFGEGDELEFDITGSDAGIGVDTALTDWHVVCDVCFERPFLDEDSAYNFAIPSLCEFENCRGSKNEQLQQVYAGSGFAYSQVAEGLQGYNNTWFITYKEIGQDRARRFPHQVYFDENDGFICDFLQGQVHTFYTYNAPLQLPTMINNLKRRIPSGVNIPVYTFTNVMDANGSTSCLVSVQDGCLDSEVNRKDLLTIETCTGLLDFILPNALNGNAIPLDGICEFTGTSVVKSMTYNLSDRTLNIVTRI